MALALDNLATDVVARRLLHGLVQVHLGLDMVMVVSEAAMVGLKTCHLNVLDLGLVDARALSGEEFLLAPSDHAVVNLVRLGSGTL